MVVYRHQRCQTPVLDQRHADDRSNAEIAERLVLSRRTVEHHVQDIYLKIGASTRAGAAMFAMQHGLLDQSG